MHTGAEHIIRDQGENKAVEKTALDYSTIHMRLTQPLSPMTSPRFGEIMV